MTQILDASGLTCPAPVLLAKDAIEQGNPAKLTIIVDNEASRENVTRFLQSRGYGVTVAQEGQSFRLEGVCPEGSPSATPQPAAAGSEEEVSKVLVLIASDCLGSGDDGLGRKLMINYIKTLKEMGNELWQLIFVNSGVRLTVSSSPVLAELRQYEQAGVTILACGTCLEHFALTADKAVGATTNMLDIVTATQLADKVVTMS